MQRFPPAIPLMLWILGSMVAYADEGTDFFESKVRPLLVKHCYECHSGEKTKGGLSLDSKTGWEKGGESGSAITTGEPDKSLLIAAIRYQDLEMPPSGKLPEEEIQVLETWVRMGAPDPRITPAKIGGMTAEQAQSWWAFQPLPPVASDFTSNSIDRAIDAVLDERGIAASSPADKRTWLRRATYDLTGLPPTTEEMDAFLADSSTDSDNHVLERLLASPQYGVQWGRHWLDVVRYADTAGENTDRPLVHAWRYRNWVFDAFNRDLPYNQFVQMQIAGDILFANAPDTQRSEGIIATGYLAIARRFGHDIDKDIHLTYEDIIDNLGKNFVGITTGCARCHDHKYDPVTADDYYGLMGFLASTKFSFPGCEPKGQPKDMVPLLAPKEVESLMQPWKERNAIFEAEKKKRQEVADLARKSLKEQLSTATHLLAHGKIAEGASVPIATNSSQSLESISVRKGEVLQLTVLPNDNHGADSTFVDWTIRSQNAPDQVWSTSELISDFLQSNPHPGAHGATWFLLDATDGPTPLLEKRKSNGGSEAIQSWSIGSEPSVFVNTAEGPTNVWTSLSAKSLFVHPGPSRTVAIAWTSPIDGMVSIEGRVADAHPAALDGVSFRLEHFASTDIGEKLLAIADEKLAPLQSPGPAPEIPVAYAVAEASPVHSKVHLRGDPEKLGAEIPRRWISVLGGDPLPENAGSGRKQLGDWIASEPIAARVMVNRVWQLHFGQGLVRTPNDFGSRGDLPSHPELLDQLAAYFVQQGYSIKSLHRLIMNTAAYHRSSEAKEEAAQRDPENKFLSHFNRRRLTAEEMRDSLLAVSQQLDLTPSQSHPFPPEASWTFTQHDPFNAVYDTNKRSAYLMVQRQRRHPFLALFDGADPNASTPVRQSTTVPTQALYFLNDPFFHTQATQVATALLKQPDDETRIRNLFQRSLLRDPTPSEQSRLVDFVKLYGASPEENWGAAARILLACNEFLYLD